MSLFDLTFAVDFMTTHAAVTVTRLADPGFDATGVALSRTTVLTTTVRANIQPAGEKLSRKIENFNSSDWRTVFTVYPLEMRDRLTFDGSTWQVEYLEGWADSGMYAEASVKRLEATWEPGP